MPAIGYVTKQANGGYKGQLKTLSLRAEIEIVPNTSKNADNHPDFRVLAKGYEIGAGWRRTSESSGNEYVSLSLAAPEFGAATSSTPTLGAPQGRMIRTCSR